MLKQTKSYMTSKSYDLKKIIHMLLFFLYMCMLFFFKLLLFDKITRALRLESLKYRGYLCLKKHFIF